MTRRAARLLVATAAVALGVLLPVGTGYAADPAGSTIDHSELADGTLRLLVSVGSNETIDLDSVAVTVGGKDAEATAEPAGSSDRVRRTTVLAIDTSNSMAGQRIVEARKAALKFLETVPANVEVGIVTFDDKVVVRQEPSLDREESKEVVNGLTLTLNTALYEGVQTAIETTGGKADGQRQVLVLSDGVDNTRAPLEPVVTAIRKSGVKVDVVSLEQGSKPPAPLTEMAEAGKGVVISADDPAALTAAFTSEADTLARQVLVTAQVPDSVGSNDATVEVTVQAGGTAHTAAAFLTVKAPIDADDVLPTANELDRGISIAEPLMYAALVAMAAGLIGVAYVAVGSKPSVPKLPLSDQLEVYTAAEPVGTAASRALIRANQEQSYSLAEQARQAAASVLSSNQEVENKIALRLEGAGMALKSSEWLLMHVGIAFASALLGLLVSGGNPLLAILFLVLGAAGPWIYLGVRRANRLKAFGASMADTLQLMSGSLSAGLSLAQSMDTVVREGNEPITSEFKRAIVESRLGVPLEDALEGVADRMQSRDFRWVVMAIRIQREVGGNLAELLLQVAATLREREYLRRHVRALSAEGRLSCWILGGMPPAFLVYLTVSKPDYVEPMFTTPIGWVMCAGMAVLLTVGIVWMMKVAKVEV